MGDELVVSGGGLTVRVAAGADLAALRGVSAQLAAKEPGLWGPDARDVAATRLGWVDTFERSRELIGQLAELRDELSDLDHVVLCGMGGSSLAPEVIAATTGRKLTVLDTTDPGQVGTALARPDQLKRTVVVVASKSGTTIETDSQRRAFWQAYLDAGLTEAEAGRHFVIVTDPGSALAGIASDMGAYLVLADPDVGGRYSALTAFGLVPAALCGVDIGELIEQAAAFAPSLTKDDDNPAVALAAALAPHRYAALVDDGSGLTGLGDWAEQLLAESTGKEGKGLLPVVTERPVGENLAYPVVTMGGALSAGAIPGGGVRPDISVNGPLGAQFLCWEAATALASRLIGIEPFDQPNVAESKQNTAAILAAGLAQDQPAFRDGAVSGYGTPADVTTVQQALRWLLAQIPDDGYLAVMAYLDRFADADAARLRPLLAKASGGKPVTFGWGPRFLHSTGQYHKGGPQVGTYLQITGVIAGDLPVPGRDYTFGQLQAAQAAGDRQALRGRQRPLLHLHLADRSAGITQLGLAP